MIFEGARITSRLLLEDLAKAAATPERSRRGAAGPAPAEEPAKVPLAARGIAAQGGAR